MKAIWSVNIVDFTVFNCLIPVVLYSFLFNLTYIFFQLNSSIDSLSFYSDGLRKICLREGPRALWNGTLPSLLLVCNPALQMAVYESIKRRLAGMELGTVSYFLIGAVAKAVATVLTYPLQLVQTRLRVSKTLNIENS